SVTTPGLFVELDASPIEGLVRTDTIDGDRWIFIEEERALKGMRTNQRWRLGDRLLGEDTNISLRRRQIDFAIVRRLESSLPAAADKKPRRRERTRAAAVSRP